MQLSAFIHQKSDEKIIYQVRKHPITFLPTIISTVVLCAVPVVMYILLATIWPGLFESDTVVPILALFGSFYYLSVGLFLYTSFVTFYLDLLIVTSDRLLSVKQEGLFARTVAELELYKIQDITSEVKGFFASSFNYGSLQIETAAATEQFELTSIPNPEGLRQAILDLAEESRKRHNVPATAEAQEPV